MPYIYKITNDINDKVYVGKTYDTIEERWKEHCRDYQKQRHEKRPLYAAMKKHGIEHFYIEQIEEVPLNISLEDREIYWINYYNSYHSGYNATIGGDGKLIYDHKAIIEAAQKTPNCVKLAEQFGCCPDTVRNILAAEGILISQSQSLREHYKTNIKGTDLLSGEEYFFTNYSEAGEWLIKNEFLHSSISSARNHISECCKGLRKTCGGFKWEIVE